MILRKRMTTMTKMTSWMNLMVGILGGEGGGGGCWGSSGLKVQGSSSTRGRFGYHLCLVAILMFENGIFAVATS
jgi:hypothetical protein